MNAVDMVPMCWTVSCVTRCEPEDSSDMSRMDTAELEESDSEDFCLWTDLWDEEDCPVSNAGSIVDNTLCFSNQDNLSSVDVASMGDFDSEDFDDAIGFDSDKVSVAELEWNTWDDACAWEFQNASGEHAAATYSFFETRHGEGPSCAPGSGGPTTARYR